MGASPCAAGARGSGRLSDGCPAGVFHTWNGETREIRIDLLNEAMVKIYRTWRPERHIEAGAGEMRFVRQCLAARIREQHPAWAEDEVGLEVARRIYGNAK